jgi:uncharacterized membrane protein
VRRLSRRKLLGIIDTRRIKEAVEAAERQTSGEIRVSVSTFFWGNPRKVAEKAFARLGMAKTDKRNGVLFFIVPSRRRFVILGDDGIHSRVGQEFWDRLTAVMSEKFKIGEFTDGIVRGIEEAGKMLAAHFPYDARTDTNELSDAVDLTGAGFSKNNLTS